MMGDKRFQFYARNGMEKVPIDTDGEVMLEKAVERRLKRLEQDKCRRRLFGHD